MEKIKNYVAIVVMVTAIFIYGFGLYKSTKEMYKIEINDTITDIIKARIGHQVKFSKSDDFISLGANDTEILKIGDSISKMSDAVEFKIFRKPLNSNKRTFYKNIYLSEHLDFYDFIVEKKSDSADL